MCSGCLDKSRTLLLPWHPCCHVGERAFTLAPASARRPLRLSAVIFPSWRPSHSLQVAARHRSAIVVFHPPLRPPSGRFLPSQGVLPLSAFLCIRRSPLTKRRQPDAFTSSPLSHAAISYSTDEGLSPPSAARCTGAGAVETPISPSHSPPPAPPYPIPRKTAPSPCSFTSSRPVLLPFHPFPLFC